MKKYTQPTAKVVELSVKESLSLTKFDQTNRTFGFGSYSQNTAKVTTFAANGVSAYKVKAAQG